MSQPQALPDGIWKELFPKALTVIDEIRQHGGVAEPFFTFGGGTVLMLRHGHRLSKDIDIFVPDPQSLGFVNPKLSDVAADICNSQYVEAAGSVKLILEVGEIDFVAAPNLLPDGFAFETWELFGKKIRVETAAEIVAKKMYHRGDKSTARDLFDLALVIEREPNALLQSERYFHRHGEAFVRNVSAPRDAFIRQFEEIVTLGYTPTFEHASHVALDYFDRLKRDVQHSADTANEFATKGGFEASIANHIDGIYVGPIVHVARHHVVQHLGRGAVAVHESHRLPQALQTGSEASVSLRYREGEARVASKARERGHEEKSR